MTGKPRIGCRERDESVFDILVSEKGFRSDLARQEVQNRILGWLAAGFLGQVENEHQELPVCFVSGPSRQFLGNRVHEDDFACGIGGDNAVSHTAKRGGEPGFAGSPRRSIWWR